MSDRIRGRPPQTPDIARPKTDEATETKKATTPATNPPATESESGAVDKFDKFDRQAKAGAQLLEARLAGLAKGGSATKIQFSNEDVAYLANTFAAILLKNPGADRLKRARLFSKTVLKRLKKLFGQIPEAELEQMCDVIGDVLDSSPVFGQLVDNVTDGANRMNSKS